MHIWLRHETRPDEKRSPLTPDGAAQLISAGIRVTVEESPVRIFPDSAYAAAECEMADTLSWPEAPADAVILGLKELPDDGTPLRHAHIMFGHAFKGQISGQKLLERFAQGGGTLLDLEYLTDESGRRVAAFGYWAGFAGAAVSVLGWAGPVANLTTFDNQKAMIDAARSALDGRRPSALVIGALGRVGHGAADLCEALDMPVTRWDMAETAHGGPFPEILAHDLFFNCILAHPGTPVFVGADGAADTQRTLRVIGDIACDPDSDYNPIPLYERATSWAQPLLRVADDPVLEVMAIDNLPSLLPLESAEDFAEQLLPHLMQLPDRGTPVWAGATETFRTHLAARTQG